MKGFRESVVNPSVEVEGSQSGNVEGLTCMLSFHLSWVLNRRRCGLASRTDEMTQYTLDLRSTSF